MRQRLNTNAAAFSKSHTYICHVAVHALEQNKSYQNKTKTKNKIKQKQNKNYEQFWCNKAKINLKNAQPPQKIKTKQQHLTLK